MLASAPRAMKGAMIAAMKTETVGAIASPVAANIASGKAINKTMIGKRTIANPISAIASIAFAIALIPNCLCPLPIRHIVALQATKCNSEKLFSPYVIPTFSGFYI